MKEDAAQIRGSSFLRELFRPGVVDALVSAPRPSGRDLLLVYALWRFGELNRL